MEEALNNKDEEHLKKKNIAGPAPTPAHCLVNTVHPIHKFNN